MESILPERGVPTFDGTLRRWKEHEKQDMAFITTLTLGETRGRGGAHASSRPQDKTEDLSADELAKPYKWIG